LIELLVDLNIIHTIETFIFQFMDQLKMSSFSQNSLMTNGGRLTILMGPMFAGKTSTLISELTRYVDVDIPVLYINSSEDTRGERFSTHNSSLTQISPKIKTLKTKQLMDIEDSSLKSFDVIAIDESQFFGDLVLFVKKCLKNKKIMYVAGLDGDIEQNIFGEIVYLIPYATEVRKLNAVCDVCRKDKMIVAAPFTIRHSSCSKDKKVIGGKDIYFPVCIYHLYHPEASKKDLQPEYYRFELDGINHIK